MMNGVISRGKAAVMTLMCKDRDWVSINTSALLSYCIEIIQYALSLAGSESIGKYCRVDHLID